MNRNLTHTLAAAVGLPPEEMCHLLSSPEPPDWPPSVPWPLPSLSRLGVEQIRDMVKALVESTETTHLTLSLVESF